VPTPAINLSDVSFIRSGRSILSGIDLEIGSGETWALLGPNGAGKSSLLHICAAINFPSRGRVSILGSVMGKVDLRELRKRIGFVDPRHPLGSDLAALEVVLTGLTSTNELVPHWHCTNDQLLQAAQMLAAVGVDQQRRWRTMSQGERGRTLIARALVSEPRLLLLDEPSTGLDLAAREQMIRTIDGVAATSAGVTTVMVTHHFEELPASTTHAALVRDGRIVAAGAVERVLTSEKVTECFAHPIVVARNAGGRWSAQAS
jgi:iron complex transport system ATP-binding protein